MSGWRDWLEHAVTGNEYNKTVREGWHDEHGSYYTHIANDVPQSDVDSHMRGVHGLYEWHKKGK